MITCYFSAELPYYHVNGREQFKQGSRDTIISMTRNSSIFTAHPENPESGMWS
ncbi:MAG: hypothetical protein ACMUIA_06665 [bacterium]